MKKTNIRMKGFFIIEGKENEYYLSSIDDLDEWKEIKENELEEYKREDVTTKLKDMIQKYGLSSNVNFF